MEMIDINVEMQRVCVGDSIENDSLLDMMHGRKNYTNSYRFIKHSLCDAMKIHTSETLQRTNIVKRL